MNGHGDESESRKFREGLWLSLENRVRKVEGDVRALETELKHMATEAYVSTRETANFRWLVGVLLAAVFATIAALIRTFVN